MMDIEYRLISQLKHYGLDYLIPDYNNSDDDESEGVGHTHLYGGVEVIDPTDDRYYDSYFAYDDELSGDHDEYRDDDDDDDIELSEGSNLDDLLRVFNADFMDYSELLNSNLWDILGITKKQLDMINFKEIPEYGFSEFFDAFTEDLRLKSFPIEKRILYSIAQACTGYRSMYTCHDNEHSGEDMLQYAERLIDTHSMQDSEQLISMLFDYYRFFPDAIEMNARRLANGEEVFKYVLCPKPSHIRDLHDKAFRDHQAMETERMSVDRRRLDEMIRIVSDSNHYKQYLYSNDKYVVLPATCQNDLSEEGAYLNHCVASYGSYMAKGASYIYFIRRAEDKETPFFTAEILPSTDLHTKSFLNQCYTRKDTITKPDSLKNFIIDWSLKKNFSIRCRI